MKENVLHCQASEPATLLDFVANVARISLHESLNLLNFGAIYCNRQRCTENISLHKGDYVRIHTHPKLYPMPTVPTAQLILDEQEDFIVASKTWGLPSIPTLDNAKQNMKWLLEQHTSHYLYPVHRLDQQTTGVMLFAKTQAAVSQFQKAWEKQKVRKIYRAYVEQNLTEACYRHYIEGIRPPFLMKDAAGSASSKECRLQILSSIPTKAGPYFFEDNKLYPKNFLAPSAMVELRILLLTGRTHQIRAQLAALDRPLLGDSLYGSPRLGQGFALQSLGIWFTFKDKAYAYQYPE